MPGQIFVDGPAGRLLVDDGGSGPGVPVVLIHSLGGNRGQWAPQLTHLRRTRRVVALDLRGHGGSAAPADRRYAPSDYAADVLRVLDACGIGRAVVVVSFGVDRKSASTWRRTSALANYRGPMVTVTTPMNEFPSSLHRVVARIRQEKMTGVSHWLHLDRPDEFNAALDRFLAGIAD